MIEASGDSAAEGELILADRRFGPLLRDDTRTRF